VTALRCVKARSASSNPARSMGVLVHGGIRPCGMLPCVTGLLSADVAGERDASFFVPEDISPKLEFLRQNLLKIAK
jgi:hypothetical protein